MKPNAAGMSLIVKTITRLTAGLILIYGFYMVISGENGPGGGFAGGIIIALSFIHIMLAFGKDMLSKALPLNVCVIGTSIAALIILLGFLIDNPKFSLISELSSAAMVAFGIFAIFLVLALVSSGGKKA